MSTQSTTTSFDLARFARAIEERDSSTQLEMYADGAQVTLADRVSQPGHPRILRGKEEIRTWVEDVCARDMAHTVQGTVLDNTGAAFTEACLYPDGTNVLCATVLELHEGKITGQIAVQAWDEVAPPA